MTGDYPRIRALRRKVAHLLFATEAGRRFVVAGGAALEALGLLERETDHLDAFSGSAAPIATAASQLADAAVEAGLTVTHFDARPNLEGTVSFVRLVITDADDTELKVELAHDPSVPTDPALLRMTDLGPTLPPHIAIGNKLCALDARRAPRDYVDVWAARHAFTRDQMLTLARAVDPGFSPHAFTEALDAIAQIPDDELPSGSPRALRSWTARFAADIRAGELGADVATPPAALPTTQAAHTGHDAAPDRCGAWMPVARTYCRRPRGHRGPHRSR